MSSSSLSFLLYALYNMIDCAGPKQSSSKNIKCALYMVLSSSEPSKVHYLHLLHSPLWKIYKPKSSDGTS